MTAPSPRVLVVSASDSRFMGFLVEMIASLGTRLSASGADLACLDLGLDPADRDWLLSRGHLCAAPRAHLGVRAEDHSPTLRSFLARPFLRDYFPGYDVYVWIDSDVWLQDPSVFDEYVAGALTHGMAITHERERAYRLQLWLQGWTAKHMVLGYGPLTAAHLMRKPHLNAGFFAIRADAPHWDAWARRYEAAIRRTGALVPHDQFALNHALHGDLAKGEGGGGAGLDAKFLDPRCNWICDRGIPMWNDAAGAFCRPYAPFDTIGAMHLAGPAKRTRYAIRRTGGGSFDTYLARGASPDHPRITDLLGQEDGHRAAA